MHAVVDCKVWSVTERVHAMEHVVAFARTAIARVGDYMSRYVNRCRRDLPIDMECFTWLSTENLSLCPRLTRKLATKFSRSFKVLEQIG